MTDLFLTVAEITLAMTPLLLLAWLFARLGKRFAPRCRFAIWVILLLRLAIPFNTYVEQPVVELSPPTAFTPVIIEQTQTAPQTPPLPPELVATAPVEPITLPESEHAPVAVSLNLVPTAALTVMWVVGVCAVLIWEASHCISAARRLRRWKRSVNDQRLIDALDRARERVAVRRRVGLWLCPEVTSPMLRGLLFPEILLPHGDYTDEQLDAIFTHELIHLRRADLITKLLAILSTALHFFNPFVWLARREMEFEMEQSCDDAVFLYGQISRHSYAETMLAVAREGIAAPRYGLNTRFHAPARALKQRFANILDRTSKREGTALVVAVIVVSVLLCAFVSCRVEPMYDENAVIAAADAALGEEWDFTYACVFFDGENATLTARHCKADQIDFDYADLTLVWQNGAWKLTDGEDATRNRRTAQVRLDEGENAHAARVEALKAQFAAHSSADRAKIEMLVNHNQTMQNAWRAADTDTMEQLRREVRTLLADSLSSLSWPLDPYADATPANIDGIGDKELFFAVPTGTKVLAAADGRVLETGYDAVDGNYILISHKDEVFTCYANLAEVRVKAGDTVTAGMPIGLVGRSGSVMIDGVLTFSAYIGEVGINLNLLYPEIREIASRYERLEPTTAPTTTLPPVVTTAPIAPDTIITSETSTTPPPAPTSYFSLVSPLVSGSHTGSTYSESDGRLTFATVANNPVYAAAPGFVEALSYDPGNPYVTIRHDEGYLVRYNILPLNTLFVEQKIPQSQYIGVTVGHMSMQLFDAAGHVIDPQRYLHWGLRADYSAQLHSLLPLLHSWSQTPLRSITDDTVALLGNHHAMLMFAIEGIYPDKVKTFGQLDLLQKQLRMDDGTVYPYVWQAHTAAHDVHYFAIRDGSGMMYSKNGQAWAPIQLGQYSGQLGPATRSGTLGQNPDPLFNGTVWFVLNEEYRVVLTGEVTVEIYVPLTEKTLVSDMPIYHAAMPVDGIISGETRATVTADYNTLRDYLARTYGVDHGCTALVLTERQYEGHPRVWQATLGNGRTLRFAMGETGGFVVGQVTYGQGDAELDLFSTPAADGAPSGQLRLRVLDSEWLPCPVSFPLEGTLPAIPAS